VGWIDLDNAANVRDLGGLPTTDGGRTRPGRLIRADNLQSLSPADVHRLVDDLGVSTVVDLRGTAERRSEGPGPLAAVAAVTHVHHSVFPESAGMTDVAADALIIEREQSRAAAQRRAMERFPDDIVTAYYLGYLDDRPDSVTGALASIATAPGAALVHCAAGKDRTGVVCALALTAVGVDRDTVVADYVASATRLDAILDRLRASPTYGDDIDRKPASEHAPRAETMIRFLDTVDTQFGGVPAWLADHGFAAEELRRLRAKLLD
jgi:protein-tyrosine phosphatase